MEMEIKTNVNVYIVSVHRFIAWSEQLCTFDIGKAIKKGNDLLEQGNDVSITSWTTETDSETCTLEATERNWFTNIDDIVTWTATKRNIFWS